CAGWSKMEGDAPAGRAVFTMKEGDFVVLKREDVFKAVQLLKKRKIFFEKQWFYLDNAIGHHYGTTFEVSSGGALQPKKPVSSESTNEATEAGIDNRNIIDDGKSQKLTRDDIEALKEQGKKGQEIVQHLIENSTTFRDKTEFAQEKYIKKKKKKYEASIKIVKPSARILAAMYHAREPSKICHLRYDTLAQMLTLGNIHAGSKVIVVETCAGLVLGAVMERMGGLGSVIQLYPGGGPLRAATDNFGFPASFSSSLYEFPLNKINSLRSGTFSMESSLSEQKETDLEAEENNEATKKANTTQEEEDSVTLTEEISESSENAMGVDTERPENAECKEKTSKKEKLHAEEKKRKQEERRKRQIEAAVLLQKKNADGLIIASRFHPCPLLLSLLGFVASSRPFVVYCQYKEPLVECYTKLRDRGGVINLRLSETWLRHYQVLPDRTHPKLLMSGGGGYLLSGITVDLDNTKPIAKTRESQKTEEPAAKRQKILESD
uniref:tRNA (adenine(58)-N(1))-methyltransferase non-catalytic subunit TRM6 n=1 Tax=Latimeria chalumnae TaxID=7897 RepID=H3B9Z7_LATCH